MSEGLFSRLFGWVALHKRLVAAALLAIVALCAAALPRIHFENNIETMLPRAPAIQRNMQFLREAKFAGKVVISLEATAGVTTEELLAATDRLAGQFGPPLVNRVTTGVAGMDIGAEMVGFLRYTPQLAGPQSLGGIKGELEPSGVEKRLKKIWAGMLSPSAMVMGQFYRIDPFGLSLKSLGNLQKLTASLGYEVTLENGHFVSRDGRHTMIILDTPVSLTDGFGSRRLIGYVEEKVKSLPATITAQVIAGHLHTLNNEDTIKQDITRTSLVAGLGFLLIFFLVFRDWRRLIFFVIPFMAVVVATTVSSLVFRSLSYFVVGMGAVVVGIADDYAIYVYMAVRTAGRRDIVKETARPLTLAALITVSVFGALFFSHVEGYRQFSFFASLSILLCLAFVLFVFPHLLKTGTGHNFAPSAKGTVSVKTDRLVLSGWLLLTVFLAMQALRVQFNNDLSSFDATQKSVLQSEEKFHAVWGGKEPPAILVVKDRDGARAQAINEAVYRAAQQGRAGEKFASLASVWPSVATRAQNRENWCRFWEENRNKALAEMFKKYGRLYHFSPDAFAPFFGMIADPLPVGLWPQNSRLFDSLKERFVQETAQGTSFLSYFPDDDALLAEMEAVVRQHPGSFIISRKAFARDIAQASADELGYLATMAVALMVLLTMAVLKNIRLTVIALSSVLSAIVAIVGGAALLGKALNAPAAIASLVVLGVTIDYGIFILYSYQHKLNIGTPKAVAVSAATAVFGAASLLFARHPMLYSIGVVLTLGLLAGFLASQFVVPALYRLWVKER